MIRSFALPALLAAAWLPLAGVELRYPLRLEEIRRLPVEQRRQAYIAIAQDNRKLADYGEAIPYLLAGIRDGDQLIRRTATMQGAGLLTILQANRQIGRPLSLDVASIGEVQDALIGVAFDPDPQTRGAAREALIYSDAPSEWIERLAIACYKRRAPGQAAARARGVAARPGAAADCGSNHAAGRTAPGADSSRPRSAPANVGRAIEPVADHRRAGGAGRDHRCFADMASAVRPEARTSSVQTPQPPEGEETPTPLVPI